MMKVSHHHKNNANQFSWRVWLLELTEEEQEENPAISPWKWSGTMRYIHYECLRTWLHAKWVIQRRNEDTISYGWKSFDWELWKTPFPESFIVRGKKIDLIQIEKPEGPYLILESITKTCSKSFHVLGMKYRNLLKIGRGHDSEVRIGDISVSRLHAIIK